MSTRILVNGANGRMGQMTVETLAEYPEFSLVGKTTRQDNLTETIQETRAEIVIDFTHPDAVYQNTLTIIKAGAHPVIGTTGLQPSQIKELQEHCKKLKWGGIIAPNFSLGMMLLLKYAQDLVKYFPDVEIIEMHHNRKKDSPSGTALYTAEMLAATNHKTIPIHAIRLPGLIAHEQIIFGSIGETITLKHDTTDRQCFMRGIYIACQKVTTLNQLIVGLENIL